MAESLPEPLLAFEGFSFVELDRAAELALAYRQHRLEGRILPNTLEAIRVELTYHSNALEGSTLTLRDTQLIVEGREPNTGKSLREIYEARNHDRALRRIEARATQPATFAESDLLAIHADVMADIDPAGAGCYRADRVLITGTRFVPPGPHKFPALMPVIVERTKTAGLHPVLQATEHHDNLIAVHPVADGNGRTARLAMNAHLLRHGYSPAIVPVERRPD